MLYGMVEYQTLRRTVCSADRNAAEIARYEKVLAESVQNCGILLQLVDR